MKCPWLTTMTEKLDYSQDSSSGRPIKVLEQTFSECIQKECPFYGSRDQVTDICLRTLRRA